MERIFIVGCARSGTTLLQSLVAAHPKLTSYPETHFWDYTIPKKWWFRLPKIYTKVHQKLIRDYLTEHKLPLTAMSGMGHMYITTKSWSGALLEVLDRLTDNEYEGWIEKTPRHLYCIPFIKAADPNARFIHIVREGIDVVASLYQVSREYPEHWNGAKTIDQCITKWANAIKRSQEYLDDPRHAFVYYDDLLEHREEVLEGLCAFMDLPFVPKMAEDFQSEAKNLVGESEKWKKANIQGRENVDKFSQLFNSAQQEYIISKTQSISLEAFKKDATYESGFGERGN